MHSHNYDSFKSSTIVGPSAPQRKKRSAAAHSSWTSKADGAEKGYFSYTCSSFVLPPPPPQKRVPCASSPQWIDCPVEGAKAKSAGKSVPASCTSVQSFEEPKSMQNEFEMSFVNEDNSVSGISPLMFNPPHPPKKKTHTVLHSSWTSPTHGFEEQTMQFVSFAEASLTSTQKCFTSAHTSSSLSKESNSR